MKNIVLVNSKIVVSNHSFSYSQSRSIYSINDRFKQTKETIKSVKKYIPNSYIVFIDNSDLTDEMVSFFNKNVDIFLNPKDDLEMQHDTDQNPTKAVGELAHLKYAISYIDKINFEWENLFKICGRYTLNSKFNFQKFDNSNNILRINEPLTNYKTIHNKPKIPVESLTCYFTSFYKISLRNFEKYKEVIEESYNLFKYDENYFNEPIELVLFNHMEDKIAINPIGLTINCAVEKWIEKI